MHYKSLCQLIPVLIMSSAFSNELSLAAYYTSSDDIKILFEKDLHFQDKLGNIFSNEPLAAQNLNKYPPYHVVKSNKLLSEHQIHEPEHLYHPINQFLVLWKFGYDWIEFADLVLESFGSTKSTKGLSPSQEFSSLLEDIRSVDVPEKEVLDAATSILRLQELYDISAADILNGDIKKLTLKEAYKIIEQAKARTDLCRAIDWAKALVHNSTFKISSIYQRLALQPTPDDCALKQCFSGHGSPFCFEKSFDTDIFMSLCASPRNLNTTMQLCLAESSELMCTNFVPDPSFTFGPLQLEHMSQNPGVYLIHRLYTEEECDLMWGEGIKLQARSELTGVGENFEDETRVGTNGWLRDREMPIAMNFSRRLASLSKLSLDAAEDWQVATYGLGGHYYLHTDYIEGSLLEDQWFRKMGWINRFVTFMVYLSDVVLGGATAFPRIGLSIPPVKGTAVLWFNLGNDGEGDPQTHHAGCPVLLGSKKIANKWVDYWGQDHHYICSADNHPTILPSSLF